MQLLWLSVDALVSVSISMSIPNCVGLLWETCISIMYGLVGGGVELGYWGCPLFSSLPSVFSFSLALCILGCWGDGDGSCFDGLGWLGGRSVLPVPGFCAGSFSVLGFGPVDVRPVRVVGSASCGCIWQGLVVLQFSRWSREVLVSVSISMFDSFGFVWGAGLLVMKGWVGECVGAGYTSCSLFSGLLSASSTSFSLE